VLDQFSRTVEKLYAAAAGACSWQEALVAVEDLTGSAGAVIDLVPKSDSVARRTLAGSFTEENCAEYAERFQSICPRVRYAMQQGGWRTQYDYLFMTEAEMDRDPVYEWFGSHGLRYYLGSPAAHTPNYMMFVSLQRTRRQGHAAPKDVELFDLVKPHLARAAGLADQMGTLRSYRTFSSAMLEALPQAVFALSAGGAVLFANGKGRALLSLWDGLSVDGGRLAARLPPEQARLDARIAEATNPLGAHPSGWTRLSRPSGKLPFALFVAPLVLEEDEPIAAHARVIVVVHDLAEQRCAEAEMLVSLYGLTETEARLASALSGGHSLQSAAALLGMQPGTARTHLKQIFRKLGVNRQQDLVRLLTSLSTVTPLV